VLHANPLHPLLLPQSLCLHLGHLL
jgi:hypothetical protein